MIILTGGAGFIGSMYLKKLNDEGLEDILIVDHFGTGEKWKNLVGKKFRTMIDKDAFLYGLEQGSFDDSIDMIVHLGACTDTTERDADYLFENNYHYSLKLAMHCVNHDLRFVYASSAATYGLGECGYSDNVYDALKPLNMYGFSKHLFDQWILQNQLDQKFCGLKFFNVFGPNEYHKNAMSSMVYKSYLQIKQSGCVKLFRSTSDHYANGEQQRDFVYVKDVTDVIWKIQNDASIHGIFNLGTGQARSWNDLVHSVFSSMNLTPNIEYVDMPESLLDQYQNFTEARMDKLSTSSAQHIFASLEDSITDYVQEYLSKSWKNA